jgi:lipopolysaccharide biosynthesis glycosyltransferase
MNDHGSGNLNLYPVNPATVWSRIGLEIDNGIVVSDRVSMPIVLACDTGYAMQLATTLRSIVEANRSGWPLEFHVLSDGFTEATKVRVLNSLPERSASIHWISIDLSPFEQFWTRRDVSKMTFARLLIPKVFPDTVSRVLYLDTDILVLDDLKPLWEADLDGAILGAVLDNMDQYFKSDKPIFAGYEDAPRVQNYFNAGVLVIDLDRWRKEEVSAKALAYMNQHPQTPFMDQDAINFVCDGHWKKLDQRWNFHDCWNRRISNFSPYDRPAIAHFVSYMKPWDVSMLSVNASFYDTFRSRTCFARTPLEKLKDSTQRIRIHLRRVLGRYVFYRALFKFIKPSKHA